MKHVTNGRRRLILRNDMGKVREFSCACVSHDTLHIYSVLFHNDLFDGQIFNDIDYSGCASAAQVLLNVGFYQGMLVTKVKKNMVQFTANIAEEGPTPVMIKVTVDELPELHTNMLALVPP